MSLPAPPLPESTGGPPVSANRSWLRALALTAPIPSRPDQVLASVVAARAEQQGERPALIGAAGTLTYRALAEEIRRHAGWAVRAGIGKGETVGLMMANRPEFMAIWLGITQAGGVVALINTNLAGRALAHCIDIVAPRHIILDAEAAAGFASAQPHLASAPRAWLHPHGDDAPPGFASLADALATDTSPDLAGRAPTIRDLALYIYTSGTTGLPKAARVSHQRVMMWSHWLAGMMDAQPEDRLYDCLPMYHSIGGVAAPGALLAGGGSVVVASKFSARRFWDDVVAHDCTLFQYIGELCRYLLAAPGHPQETAHRLRLACGNGLRPDVWTAFQERFRIPQILEFYAATEGNISLYNAEGKPGAIGRIPKFLAHRFPLALVRLDEGGVPLRDGSGHCLPCAPGEPGEAVGRIVSRAQEPGGRFEGYTGAADTEKKILRDVFAPGDAWFRTGDLMRRDAQNYFYFVDRLGDTFRWKGENVATTEVAEAITAFPGISEATVYGVAVPGHDGRAGMAAVVAAGDLDWAALYRHLATQLPAYARPLFLRLIPAIAVTATFKHRKADLVREGFDPGAIAGPLYVAAPDAATYERLDAPRFARIRDGLERF
jgi:fatty-acyl-CoA synthase